VRFRAPLNFNVRFPTDNWLRRSAQIERCVDAASGYTFLLAGKHADKHGMRGKFSLAPGNRTEPPPIAVSM
jgi:hypothetical protein